MGRHAADPTAPGPPDPHDKGESTGQRLPRHADLIRPRPDGAVARLVAERAARTFDRLVEPHRDVLRAYILRLTEGDEAMAESILKETLYRAAQEPGRHHRNPSAVRPWLFLNVRGVLRDGERRAPAGHDDRPDPPPAQEDRLPDRAALIPVSTILAAMEDLPAADRQLIAELCYGGVSVEAAAAARGVPEQTIKSQLYHAIRAFRAALARRAG